MARKLVGGVASAALVALIFFPAHGMTSINGTILMATAGTPAAARLAYVVNNYDNVGDASSQTWALGFVYSVPAGVSHFKVAPAAAGSVGDFDIFFYDGDQFPENALPDEDGAANWAGPGPHCDRLPTGTAGQRTRWAIVTLSVGAAEQFSLQVNNAPISC